jgi:hypothetical protein
MSKKINDFLLMVRTNPQIKRAYREYLEEIQKSLDRIKLKDHIHADMIAGKKFMVEVLLEEAN